MGQINKGGEFNVLSHTCCQFFYLSPLTSVLYLLLPLVSICVFSLPHSDSFSSSMSCLPLCLLVSFITVPQMKFPNLEVTFDIWKPEVQQQPAPWLICTLWPKCDDFQTICSRFTGAAKANKSAEIWLFRYISCRLRELDRTREHNAILLHNRLGINHGMYMY